MFPLVIFVGSSGSNYSQFKIIADNYSKLDDIRFWRIDYQIVDAELIKLLDIKVPLNGYYIRIRHPDGSYKDYYEQEVHIEKLDAFVTYKGMINQEATRELTRLNNKHQICCNYKTTDRKNCECNLDKFNKAILVLFEGKTRNDEFISKTAVINTF
jgi:hypothetical protein